MPGILEMQNKLTGAQPVMAVPKPAAALPELRRFGDAGATRKMIFHNVLQAARKLPAMENQRHILTLHDVDYLGADEYSISERKKAILEGRTLGRRLHGTWVLRNKEDGSLLDKRKMTIARVPYMTDAGTFVHNGNEYTIANQLRLKPGNYTRIKENGELETHANILPGKGRAHRYFLDPERGTFYMRLGQAKIPLIALLKTLGADDRTLQDNWGPEIFAANRPHYSEAAVKKIYEKLVRRKPAVLESMQQRNELIKDAFEAMEVDPGVMMKTLGKNYDRLSLETVLATTKKLIAVGRGEAEVDDRDHLAHQTLFGPEDLFAERVSNDYSGARRKIFNQSSWAGNLQKMQPGIITKALESVLLTSGLGQAIEEINPGDVFDKQFRISRMGESGIPSIDAIPDEARSVQPSHFAYVDPIRTPESLKAGVDTFLSSAIKKGRDGKIYAPFTDARSGKTVWRSPQDVDDLAIAFPHEMQRNTERIFAMYKGKIRAVPKEKVDLILPHFENAFSPLANLVPLKSMMKGQRLAMGSRMMTQALPVIKPEAPWVQAGLPGSTTESYETKYGQYMGSLRAGQPGRVLSVDDDKITVQYRNGMKKVHELYNNFPYNRKTYIHQTPLVQTGDVFDVGTMLAKSNYTDDSGATALGKNARVAYIPFRGLNFEDAIVISKGFAEKMTSEHMYQHRTEFDTDHKRSKNEFRGIFPGKFTKRQWDTITDEGAIKPGTRVEYGDPIILSAVPREIGHHKILRKKSQAFEDQSLIWDHHTPGLVTDVVRTRKGTTVLVKSQMPMQVGDKLSGRYGGKGIISAIIPDDEVPHDREGNPYEVLLNPLGVISRTNPAQMVEAALGKIAAKRGTPFIVPDFENEEDMVSWALHELEKAGLTDLEDIIDPETERKIPNVFTGNRFFMKLHHTAESKSQGRATGGYTQEGLPAKGGTAGSKRISLMDTNALLSHGAMSVLRDANSIRGQRNEEYWLAFMQGYTPPQPAVPLVFQKFVNELKASGVNVVPDGGQLNVMAMTDKDVDTMTKGREIASGETINFGKGMKPVTGGLFDPKLTGGHYGNKWSYIRLPEPMPNPVMEEPIRRILGLTQKKFEAILSCKENLPGGDCGPAAMQEALASLNVTREILKARVEIKGSRKTDRDTAIRRLGYLKSAKRLGIHPKDWMVTKVPVLPPIFRPISIMSDSEIPLVSDANYLYKELIDATKLLTNISKEVEDVGDERLAVYSAFKAVTGLGDPTHPKLQEKGVRGFLKHIFGRSPKTGTVQRRLISSPVDLVGRAVIAPNPDLDMDHVGLPETKAWDVYRNFVIRRLRRRGVSLIEAMRHAEDRTPEARQALMAEIEDRPVFINRAPVLHKFGIMAFWPKLVKGDVLQVSPLVVGGFNADFDGDAMQYHVPVDEDAKDDAINLMMPSHNLISPADFKTPVHKPSQEYVGGLYAATSKPSSKLRPHYFASEKDAIAAYRRGDISINTPIRIRE